ncbi:methylated-DNA--[protein]-cysteine S-methyltransferase [Streptosporangium sp. NPDC051022]|uniref:methylated-DNA--[protein]-cysteine S-methyltransferase n=1 Tax=Streptosporangium sp. NPDC051022 TaxID=3155752 RepID=UPI00343160A6
MTDARSEIHTGTRTGPLTESHTGTRTGPLTESHAGPPTGTLTEPHTEPRTGTRTAQGRGAPVEAQVLPTPTGPLALLAHEGVIVAAGFTADPREMFVRLPSHLQALGLVPVDDLGHPARAVRDYLDGDLKALDEVELTQPGTPKRQRLLKALREVPPGVTISYAELAERAGLPRTAARAAGGACAQNLIAPFVPCHRILPSGGGFGGYYYGTPVKRWLLVHEKAIPQTTLL